MRRLFGWLMAVACLAAAPVLADEEWFKIDTLEAVGKGDAKEVSVGHKVEKVRVVCTEGSVIINTIVVRHHGKADPHKVGQRLEKGQKVAIQVSPDGKDIKVDGLRISDDGKGKYKVEARK